MEGVLTMSAKEVKRAKIIHQVTERKLTVSEATEMMQLTERQAYRVLKRYRQEGDSGLIHRLRGKASNRGYAQRIREHVVKLFKTQYRDYGPTYFAEMLTQYHHLGVDHETVRRWLYNAGLGTPYRKKRPHRRKRERRSAIGAMIQFDGSEHDWFEGCGPRCCLLHAIDDASGRVFLRFVSSENAEDALRTMWLYCERFGIPKSLYTDRGSVFYAENGLTDFGRAMQSLGVEMIFAGSPQAKGRVERGNRTHQDRLVKALRREGISTIADANRYLEEHYLSDHNTRFAQEDTLPDIHRPATDINFNNTFCFQTERCVKHDYTITLDSTYVQLEKSETPLPLPRQYVTVRRWLDGSLHLFWKDKELLYTVLKHKPQRQPRKAHRPAPNHPWRMRQFGASKKSHGEEPSVALRAPSGSSPSLTQNSTTTLP
jgi:transposase